MSIELYLARFDPSGKEVPKHANVLREMELIARKLTEKAGDSDAVSPAVDGPGLDIELPGGTATVRPTFGQFPIQELDALTMRVVFEIARSGDMVVITEGGNYLAILTDAAQRTRLPADWQDPKESPVCDSPKQLKRMLQEWYALHKEYAERAFIDVKEATRAGVAPVVNSDRTESLDLYRFDCSGNEVPRHPDVLRDLFQVAESHLAALGRKARITKGNARFGKKSAAWAFEVEFPLGDVEVFASHAHIDLYDLDLPTTRLLFDIARTGEMSFIVFVDGKWQVIFADGSQIARAPKGWIKPGEPPIVCCAAEQLLPELRQKLELEIPPEKRVRFRGADCGLSGAGPTFPASVVYVEAKPKESATMQQKKVYKYHSQIYKAGGPHRPNSGMMMSEFWRLETPAGQAFYAYGYGGDKETYLALIRDFATAEGRAVGWIQNFDTFVQDDGRSIPLSACKCMKVKE